jgi:general stress protein 26
VSTHDTNGPAAPLSDLLEKHGTVAMVMTMVGDEHTSRPLTCVSIEDDRLGFLVPRDAEFVKAIAAGDAVVHITVADPDQSIYLWLNGTATVVHDQAVTAELWSPPAKGWFSGPDDPNLAVLFFDVSEGAYWRGPSTAIGRAVALAKASLGNAGSTGSHGPISPVNDLKRR